MSLFYICLKDPSLIKPLSTCLANILLLKIIPSYISAFGGHFVRVFHFVYLSLINKVFMKALLQPF
ncbi:hypothetical protein bcgnr5371_24640 [Bacillus cereus]